MSADAYSRTYLSSALAVSEAAGPLRTERGLVLLPDVLEEAVEVDFFALSTLTTRPLGALDHIGSRYGGDVASFVALQLAYSMGNGELAETMQSGH